MTCLQGAIDAELMEELSQTRVSSIFRASQDRAAGWADSCVSNPDLFVWHVAAEAVGRGRDLQLEAAIGELMRRIRYGGRPRPPRVRGVTARALAWSGRIWA